MIDANQHVVSSKTLGTPHGDFRALRLLHQPPVMIIVCAR
jgi:hypothetical protein